LALIPDSHGYRGKTLRLHFFSLSSLNLFLFFQFQFPKTEKQKKWKRKETQKIPVEQPRNGTRRKATGCSGGSGGGCSSGGGGCSGGGGYSGGASVAIERSMNPAIIHQHRNTNNNQTRISETNQVMTIMIIIKVTRRATRTVTDRWSTCAFRFT